MKFLVLWEFQSEIRGGLPEVAKLLTGLRAYARELHDQGRLERYYHVVGKHGGALDF